MANKGRSERGLFGTVHHYDEHGKKVGRSEPGLFGGYTNYDANGKKIGHSDPGLFGGYNHYDNNGHKTGHSDPSLAAITTEIPAAKALVPAPPECSGHITTVTAKVAMWQHACTDPMIVRRSGRCVVSETTRWQRLCWVDRSSVHTTQSAPRS